MYMAQGRVGKRACRRFCQVETEIQVVHRLAESTSEDWMHNQPPTPATARVEGFRSGKDALSGTAATAGPHHLPVNFFPKICLPLPQ